MVRKLSAACILAGVATGYLYSAQLKEWRPVTVTQRLISYNASTGAYSRTKNRIRAVRRDGSTSVVVSFETPQGVSFATRQITDRGRSLLIRLESVSKSRQTSGLRAENIDIFEKGRSDCTSDSIGERSEYHGYTVVKSVRTAGYLTIETWRAPDLNCLELRSVVTKIRPGQDPVVANRTETEAISLGEPDPKLFEVPAEFVERRPSEMYRIVNGILGIPNFPDREAEADAGYERGQRALPR